MNWYTSDHHFGHTKIIDYCARPFDSVDHMDRVMIERWNAVVAPVDTVYYLGDLALYYSYDQLRDLIQALHGVKILICGNHDNRLHSKRSWRELGFTDVSEHKTIAVGPYMNVRLSHYPRNYILDDQDHYRIHGHVHGAYVMKGRSLNVGADVHEFTPVSESRVIDYFMTAIMPRPKSFYTDLEYLST
jgi:calcineurin-like phosphoesterase family protein